MFIQPLGPIREHSHEPWAPSVSCIDSGTLFDVLVECLFGVFSVEHKRTESAECLAVIQFLRKKKTLTNESVWNHDATLLLLQIKKYYNRTMTGFIGRRISLFQ